MSRNSGVAAVSDGELGAECSLRMSWGVCLLTDRLAFKAASGSGEAAPQQCEWVCLR